MKEGELQTITYEQFLEWLGLPKDIKEELLSIKMKAEIEISEKELQNLEKQVKGLEETSYIHSLLDEFEDKYLDRYEDLPEWLEIHLNEIRAVLCMDFFVCNRDVLEAMKTMLKRA